MELDRESIERQARAAVMWVESRESILRMIRAAGLSNTEACELHHALERERTMAVREEGLRQVLASAAMVLVPVGCSFFLQFGSGRLYSRLFGIAIAIGVFGLWKLTQGAVKLAAPDQIPGSVADMGGYD